MRKRDWFLFKYSLFNTLPVWKFTLPGVTIVLSIIWATILGLDKEFKIPYFGAVLVVCAAIYYGCQTLYDKYVEAMDKEFYEKGGDDE